jgi:EAL domain-containing protein (putative c-di-GMP-specific phosphodiesterase class I)
MVEGAETAEQRAVRHELGCDLVQGYFICKPLAPADFQHSAAQRTADATHAIDMATAQS